jgi:hypothetical protein
MMVAHKARLVALVMVSGIVAGCRNAPRPEIEAGLANSVPADAVVLCGLDYQRLRASAAYGKLPAATVALLEPLRPAAYLLVAFNGRDYLLLGRGPFGKAPAGATLLAPDLAVAGSEDAVRAATAQHGRGSAGSALPGLAEKLASGHEIWMVAMGNATLPVTGNAQNLNGLLHQTEYTTVVVHVTDGIEMEATGVCATSGQAERLEGELRAMASIGAAAERRRPEIAGLLRAIQVNRQERTVRVDFRTDGAGVEQLLHLF